MNVKSTIYKNKVCIYTSVNREVVRISTGITSKKLNATGLLVKSSGVDGWEKKNQEIQKMLVKLEGILVTHPDLTAKQVTHLFKTGELPDGEEPIGEEREGEVIKAFRKFIKGSETGERLSDKGTKLESSTIKSYGSVLVGLPEIWNCNSLLEAFC